MIDNKSYPDLEKQYLQLLIELSIELGKSEKKYLNQLGDYHLSDSANHKESFVVHNFYIKALKQYQKAGNKNKIEDVTVLIEKAKNCRLS